MAYPSRPPPPPPSTAPPDMGSTNVAFNTQIRYDSTYLKTPIGLLRAVLLLFNIIGAICIGSSPFRNNGRGVFFCIISFLGILYSGGILYSYTFHVVEKFHNWKWLKGELVGSVFLVFMNLIASTTVVAYGSSGFLAAGFFGYLCMAMYAIEAYLSVLSLKAGAPAQGSVQTNKQQHVISPA